MNYYGDLIAAVGGLDDERAVNPLLGAITTGGQAQRALARLGPAALEPTLLELQNANADPLVRNAALIVLLDITTATSKPLDPRDKKRIENAYLKGLSDPDENVRITALRGAADLHESTMRPAREKLAADDPFRSNGTYPIRDLARTELEKW